MFSFVKNLFKKPKQIKLGLALGSGGAKGFYHLGVLKAFEEENIVFDMVAGTSIGSLIGWLYADNYTVDEILKLIDGINFYSVLSVPPINMSMDKVKELFKSTLSEKQFNELKKPFCCVAVEKQTGSKKVFSEGDVIDAVLASCCYPPFFSPYVIDGIEYLDGAYVDPIPAVELKKNGADFVVGIDLSAVKSNQSSLADFFIGSPIPNAPENPKKEGYENSDFMFKPNLSNYASIDIVRGKELFDVGYDDAKNMAKQIKEQIAKAQKNA